MQRVALGLFLLSNIGLAKFVSVGQTFSCVFDGRPDRSPVCWLFDKPEDQAKPYGEHNETKAPKVNYLIDMQSGVWHSCLLARKEDGRTKLQCFGDQNFGQVDNRLEEKIPNPVSLAVGRWRNCAIYNPDPRDPKRTKLKCWGSDSDYELTKIPKNLGNVSQVYVGSDFNCVVALDPKHPKEELVKCWGSEHRLDLKATNSKYRPIRVSDFSKLNKDGRMACSLASGKLECWTNNLGARNPYFKKVGLMKSCEYREMRLSCKKRVRGESGSTWVNEFSRKLAYHPERIDVGDYHVCVLMKSRVRCFGPKEEVKVPQDQFAFGPHFSGFKDTRSFLKRTSEMVYGFEKSFLQRIAKLARDRNSEIFVMNALRNYIRDFGYPSIKRDHMSAVHSSLIRANKSLGYDRGVVSLKDLKLNSKEKVARSFVIHTVMAIRRLSKDEDAVKATKIFQMLATSDESLSKEQMKQVNDFFDKHVMNPYLENLIGSAREVLELLRVGG